MQAPSTNHEAADANPMAKLNLSLLISAVSAYSIAVGMAYLWGYWSPFHINVLDYMGVTDILTATAWPLFGLFSAMFVGLLMGGQQSAADGEAKDNRVGRAIYWYWSNFRELHFLGLLLIWALEVPNKWMLISLLGGTPLAIYLMLQPWMDRFPLPRNIRLIVVLLVVMAPTAAISTGQSHSKNLLMGKVYQVVYSDLEGLSLPLDMEPGERLRLIGHRGDTLFMWDPSLKRTVIAKFPNDRPLVLGRIDLVTTGTGWESLVRWTKGLFS